MGFMSCVMWFTGLLGYLGFGILFAVPRMSHILLELAVQDV